MDTSMTEGAETEEGPKLETADKPKVDPARTALVTQWTTRIKEAKEHPSHKTAFERMRKCMEIAAEGTDDPTWLDGGNFVVPIVNRHINQAVSSLYAKNPTATAKRKDKLLFQIWDGDLASVQAAVAAVQAPQQGIDPTTGAPGAIVDPNAMALLQEIEEAKKTILMYDRMAKTLQILFAHYFDEQDCGYKEQFKALVRRTKVCGVGYVKLSFQRIMEQNPDAAAKLADATSQIATIEARVSQLADGEIEQDSAKAEELRLLVADLQKQVEIIVREGPVYGFPRSTEIIVDTKCRHLKTFAGARWIAHEFDMTDEEILETFKVDVKGARTGYKADGTKSETATSEECARVWEVQDKKNGQVFTVCDGHPDFLKAPAAPDVKVERFWTIFPLVFNEIEHEKKIFPPSDVWVSRHMQREYNSARQGRREHRIANRPKYVSPRGKLEDKDLKNLAGADAHEIIMLNGMVVGEKASDLLQRLETAPLDPNLYEVDSEMTDMLRVVGAQEANLGGTSGATATESSIAEQSRSASLADNIDDLDTLLSAIARATGQLLFMELDKQTVIEIAGPGAVWPDMPPTREQVVKDLFLDVEAGSSGRPNQAADLANFERAMPYLSMLPGVNPQPLAKKGLSLLNIDVEEAYVEGLPSIVAANQMAGRNPQAGGDPQADPNQQGGQGAQNAESTQANEPGPQPQYSAPGEATPQL